MKNVSKCFAYFTLLNITLSCVSNGSFTRPNAALCVVLSDHSLFCKKQDVEYDVADPVNYLCTDPDSYDLLEERNNCLEKELKKCYSNPKACKPNGGLCGWQIPKEYQERRIREN